MITVYFRYSESALYNTYNQNDSQIVSRYRNGRITIVGMAKIARLVFRFKARNRRVLAGVCAVSDKS